MCEHADVDVDAARAITWYHTIALPSGPTNGEYDLAGLRRQIESAGFEIERRGPLHFQPTGGARLRDPLPRTLAGLRLLPSQLMLRKGVPHVGVLARPRR